MHGCKPSFLLPIPQRHLSLAVQPPDAEPNNGAELFSPVCLRPDSEPRAHTLLRMPCSQLLACIIEGNVGDLKNLDVV